MRTLVPLDINTYYSNSYASEKRVGLMVHELGHAIGLGHESSRNVVMHPVTNTRNATAPAQDDVNGVNALY